MSDFVSQPYEKPLQIAARKHDLVGVHIYDKHDRELPDAGLIQVVDSETKNTNWLDTSNRSIRANYAHRFDEHKKILRTVFS